MRWIVVFSIVEKIIIKIILMDDSSSGVTLSLCCL
jgi:hypothetical protein